MDTSVVMTTGMLQLLLQSIVSSIWSGSELVPSGGCEELGDSCWMLTDVYGCNAW